MMQVCNDLADEDSPSQEEAEDPWEVKVRLHTVFGSFGGKSDSSVVSRLSQVFSRWERVASKTQLDSCIFTRIGGLHCCCKA